MRAATTAASFVAFVDPSTVARADAPDDKATCVKAYQDSQVHRRAEELLSARQELRLCASEACPLLVRSDCGQWLSEVEAAIPSVVFDARADDGPAFDVTVRVDGRIVASRIDGRPVAVDPGLHTFDFERPGARTLEQKIILREGERSRLLLADWSIPKAERPLAVGGVPAELSYRPVPLAALVTLGIGAAGLIDFGVFASLGYAKKQDLDRAHCAPFCTAGQVNAVRTPYIAADIGLAVGVAGSVASALLFLTRPARPVKSGALSELVVAPTPSGWGALVLWGAAY